MELEPSFSQSQTVSQLQLLDGGPLCSMKRAMGARGRGLGVLPRLPGALHTCLLAQPCRTSSHKDLLIKHRGMTLGFVKHVMISEVHEGTHSAHLQQDEVALYFHF